ncbi:MAG: hypothetical protein PHI31_09875 [Desulfuromonadaceae bacterium]|nr:hypothetical protein [Desulfuromonadaceae bacterium]
MSKRTSLVILWRTDGETTLAFASRKEAENHKNMMDAEFGNRIVKMELVEE